MMIKPALVVVFSTLMVLFQLGLLASTATAAPPQGPDCDTVIATNLLSCLDYVTPGSNTTTPPKDCCGGLSTIVKFTPICLCQFLNSNGNTQGFAINVTRAMGLPAACNITTPPPSECNNRKSTPSTVSPPPSSAFDQAFHDVLQLVHL